VIFDQVAGPSGRDPANSAGRPEAPQVTGEVLMKIVGIPKRSSPGDSGPIVLAA
jgi:hypothetical protein